MYTATIKKYATALLKDICGILHTNHDLMHARVGVDHCVLTAAFHGRIKFGSGAYECRSPLIWVPMRQFLHLQYLSEKTKPIKSAIMV